MDALERYRQWLASAQDEEMQQELRALDPARDSAEIHDRFSRDLSFGTGGLRGVLGAGTNRMNLYVVRRATQGLAAWLRSAGLPLRAAIAYDSRIHSDLFAREAARVLAENGVAVFLYPRLEPTPALSWAVRCHGCGAGVCITASHNPAAYNGYKVYGPDGCQITLSAAAAVQQEIEKLPFFPAAAPCSFDKALSDGRIRYIEDSCLSAFLDAVQRLSVWDGDKSGLRVVYTPLNGTGRECVTGILHRIGVQDITIVPEQELPDGHFPTCPYPNPEERAAMERGLTLARRLRADLLIGTDPDCDRMGAAVPEGDGFRPLSGNEMGVLLLDYLCRRRIENGTMPARPVAVTTIVSTGMADAVAGHYGVELRRTLTGFKFIGEQIGSLERAGEAERYLFGFEESYGYLSGSHVRDKDAVNAAMLCCEMAAWYRTQGKTLAQAMDALYARFGCWQDELQSLEMPGDGGMAQMQRVMTLLRENPPETLGGEPVMQVRDYLSGTDGLPRSDVLAFHTSHGRVTVRPSGTEPKLKLYYSARSETADGAKALCAALRGDMAARIR